MTRLKVALIYIGCWSAFAVMFAAMFFLLFAAVIGLPAGLMLGFFGIAVIMFKAGFIVTDLAPEVMLFGGFGAAFAAIFCGVLAIKTGMAAAKLFKRAKIRCDKLRGWQG